MEKEYDKTEKKKDKAEDENNRKHRKYQRDIWFFESAGVHAAKAKGIGSFTQAAQMISYPLEGDNPYERRRETEDQAEEP